MGSRLTWPHGPPVSKAFFGPFLCVKAFFGPFLCGGRPKKSLAVWGQVSDVWVPISLGLIGLQCRRLFLDPFCVRRLFLDPFCVVGCSKKNLGSVGAGVPFSGQVFFQTFLE